MGKYVLIERCLTDYAEGQWIVKKSSLSWDDAINEILHIHMDLLKKHDFDVSIDKDIDDGDKLILSYYEEGEQYKYEYIIVKEEEK